MAPPFRVDTEIPVEFDEREDLQGHDQNSLEARDSCHAPAVELDEYGTSRDETTHRRHAASLHNESDSSSPRPTSQAVTQQLTSAVTTKCPTAYADNDDEMDGLILETNDDTSAADLCPHARGDHNDVSNVLISVEASIVQYRINFDPNLFEDAETCKDQGSSLTQSV